MTVLSLGAGRARARTRRWPTPTVWESVESELFLRWESVEIRRCPTRLAWSQGKRTPRTRRPRATRVRRGKTSVFFTLSLSLSRALSAPDRVYTKHLALLWNGECRFGHGASLRSVERLCVEFRDNSSRVSSLYPIRAIEQCSGAPLTRANTFRGSKVVHKVSRDTRLRHALRSFTGKCLDGSPAAHGDPGGVGAGMRVALDRGWERRLRLVRIPVFKTLVGRARFGVPTNASYGVPHGEREREREREREDPKSHTSRARVLVAEMGPTRDSRSLETRDRQNLVPTGTFLRRGSLKQHSRS